MILLISAILIGSSLSYGQALAEGYKAELGIDGYFSVGNQGGNFSAGAKFGVLKREENSKVVIGPSVRWMRVWSNNLAYMSQPVSYNIVGIGAFMHARVVDGLYLGAEFETLKTPLNFVIVTEQRQWVPVLFLGGGYSKNFDDRFRLNVGIFYDVVNSLRSPYRGSYLTKKKVGPNGQDGALIPILYRLELFIPLN